MTQKKYMKFTNRCAILPGAVALWCAYVEDVWIAMGIIPILFGGKNESI